MSRLFALAAFATLGVACGSAVPVAPDLASPTASIDSSSTAAQTSAAASFPLFECAGRVSAIKILDVQPGAARLRAEVQDIGEDTARCASLVWTSAPKGARITPTVGSGQEAFLTGDRGRYKVTANLARGSRSATSVTVLLP